jgi:hypothetical protein
MRSVTAGDLGLNAYDAIWLERPSDHHRWLDFLRSWPPSDVPYSFWLGEVV